MTLVSIMVLINTRMNLVLFVSPFILYSNMEKERECFVLWMVLEDLKGNFPLNVSLKHFKIEIKLDNFNILKTTFDQNTRCPIHEVAYLSPTHDACVIRMLQELCQPVNFVIWYNPTYKKRGVMLDHKWVWTNLRNSNKVGSTQTCAFLSHTAGHLQWLERKCTSL